MIYEAALIQEAPPDYVAESELGETLTPNCVKWKKHCFFSSPEGHRNQRGAAPGHGVPRSPHHGRDLHRAREEAETPRRGREVGPPGPGQRHPEIRLTGRGRRLA